MDREENSKTRDVEIMMGHSIGISASYYRPLEREVLEDYLKAVPLLTISGSDYQQQIENKHQDEEIQFLKQQVNGIMAMFSMALKGEIKIAPGSSGVKNYSVYDKNGNKMIRSDVMTIEEEIDKILQ